jgi:p21-activated kinase 1
MNGVLHHRSSKETIQSHQESISNFSTSFSVHTATAAIHKELFHHSGQGPLPSSESSHHPSESSNGRDPTISDHKSFQSLQKPTFGLRNQSVSTVSTIRGPESNRSSAPTSTPRQSFRPPSLPSLEDADESSLPSTPRSSWGIAPTLVTDPRPSPSTVSSVSSSPTSDDHLLRPTDRMGATSRSCSGIATNRGKKGMLGFLKSNKRPEISTPYDPVFLWHVAFDSSTREFSGLPKEWQLELVQDSDISKNGSVAERRAPRPPTAPQ